MDRARKKLASAIDGIRHLHTKIEFDVEERVSPEHCSLSKIVRHGFPDDPKCLAFDPVQKLIAIGAGHGVVRLLGKSGVDYLLKHESEESVMHAQFLVNEGGLVTVQRDDTIHLWNYRQRTPEIVHSMQLSKERVTCLYLPFQSKWLYIGTDKGNVYFVCLANFELSTYVINWNKAIDLSCRVHPGAVRHLSVCPTENHKLLIGFERSHCSLWNLHTREAEQFAVGQSQIRCVCWHHDGKQFMCGHQDGSLTIWNLKKPLEPAQKINPHGANSTCRPVTHLIWHHNAEGEPIIVFVGGLPADNGALPAVSILRGRPNKSTVVAEMDHPIVGICALNASPFQNVPQHPYAVAVLLKSDFMVIDLSAPSFACFESPYPMDVHESPVTYINYFSDCPVDLIAALTLVGRNQRKQGVKLSERPWPITGGVGRECATGHQEMLLTGHEDGSIKFWQASSENLQIMYKLKTGRHFERLNDARNVSYAVANVEICLDSRLMLVAAACGQVTLFRFVKTESSQDISVVTLSQLCTSNAPPSPVPEDDIRSAARELRRQLETSDSRDSHSTATSTGSDIVDQLPIKVRGGSMRRPAGYQPELVCQIPWVGGVSPERITAMAINSAYGVLAIGTAAGVALVDIVTYTQIYAWANNELCGREAISFTLPSQNSDASPSESMHSSMVSPVIPNANKSSFMRLNTEKSRSVDRRPILAKAQSIAASAAAAMMNSDRCGGSELNSPNLGNSNVDISNGESSKNLNGGSRSSSATSLDRMNGLPECVTSLKFISCCSKRNVSKVEPCLWLGMSTGAVVAFVLQLPTNRIANSVVAAPSDMFDGPKGSVLRLPDRIICIAFLDRNLCLITGAAEPYRDPTKDSAPTSACLENALQNKVLTRTSLSPSVANPEAGLPPTEELSQLQVIVCEREAKVVALPSYQQVFQYRPDIPFVIAKPSHVHGYPVLMCLNGAGQLVVLSLPSLRLLFQQLLFKGSIDVDDPICQRTDFSEHGLGMYMASPSEIQKLTVCSELASQVADCAGDLFVPVDMPEPPKTSFLRGVSTLFAGQKDSVDLDSIFSEKPSSVAVAGMKSVARAIPVNNLDGVTSRNVSAGQAAAQAIQNLNERGERLNAVVDATERLQNNAMNLQSRSSALVQKYEKKRWYQL